MDQEIFFANLEGGPIEGGPINKDPPKPPKASLSLPKAA